MFFFYLLRLHLLKARYEKYFSGKLQIFNWQVWTVILSLKPEKKVLLHEMLGKFIFYVINVLRFCFSLFKKWLDRTESTELQFSLLTLKTITFMRYLEVRSMKCNVFSGFYYEHGLLTGCRLSTLLYYVISNQVQTYSLVALH